MRLRPDAAEMNGKEPKMNRLKREWMWLALATGISASGMAIVVAK